MDQIEQQGAFESDLLAVMGRYVEEFDLSYISVIGTLEVVKGRVLDRLLTAENHEEDE